MSHETEGSEARLRKALTLIGDEVALPEPPKEGLARRARLRRQATVAAGALAAAAALAVGVLVFRPDQQGRSTSPSTQPSQPVAGEGQSRTEWIACATTIAIGDVVAVEPGTEKGRLTITFNVQEWLKPAGGADRIAIDAVDPRIDGGQDPWEVGQHLLVVVPQRRDMVVDTFSGDRLGRFLTPVKQGLPDAKGAPCPSPWREGEQ
ncbi:hypothetical protein OG782_25530 [Streptomyces sp. NBC_00876]|uniref:hypothetical protein n=1 Tax=Streptomyces sp. NBC_00876 TaxID=2975853 RepID=UPI00386F2055|nr:hypothetical protein OG782_25530 [Streptomyces sp. NBC_00876]